MGEARTIGSIGNGQSKEQKEVIQEGQKEQRTVHFASLMDICHLKNAELEPKFQKYEGRFVLRGDIVKNRSDPCAVFTEKGWSASQMTAANVMDVMQAADAVSAHTQVKMEDASTSLKLPKLRMSGYFDTYTTIQVA